MDISVEKRPTIKIVGDIMRWIGIPCIIIGAANLIMALVSPGEVFMPRWIILLGIGMYVLGEIIKLRSNPVKIIGEGIFSIGIVLIVAGATNVFIGFMPGLEYFVPWWIIFVGVGMCILGMILSAKVVKVVKKSTED